MISLVYLCAVLLLAAPPSASGQCTTKRCQEPTYEPPRWENGAVYLESILKETTDRILNAVENRLADQTATMERRLAEQSAVIEANLIQAVDARLATLKTDLENSSIDRQDILEGKILHEIRTLANTTEFQLKAVQDKTNVTVGALIHGIEIHLTQHTEALDARLATLKAELEISSTDRQDITEERMLHELRTLANTTDVQLKEAQDHTNVTAGALIDGMETRLAEHIVSMQSRLAENAEVIDIRLATLRTDLGNCTSDLQQVLEERILHEIRTLANTTEFQMKAVQDQKNVTVGALIHGIEVHLTQHTEAVDARLATLKAELEISSTDRQDITEERMLHELRTLANTTDFQLKEAQDQTNVTAGALIDGMESRLAEHIVSMESRLAENAEVINIRLATLRTDLGNCTSDQQQALEEKILHEIRTLANTTDFQLKAAQTQIDVTVAALLHALEERMIGATHNGTNATMIDLEDDISQINETVRASMEARLNALCSSRDAQALVPIIHNRSNTQLQILTLLESCVEITFLRRVDGSVNFIRNWVNYASGFGNESGEFWLGLKTLHQLTTQHQYGLRVDMENWSGRTKWAQYHTFRVGSESGNYVLTVTGYNPDSTTAGDGMAHHNGAAFSTYDKDNDRWNDGNCAAAYKSGWWFTRGCHHANPTGQYQRPGYRGWYGVNWDIYNDQRSFKLMTLKLIAN